MSSSCQRSIPATVDRISDLPDTILCHILSFLPTNKAATTSILSKRWKSLWLSVLTLHFDDKAFKKFEETFGFSEFREFVHSTLFKLRDKNNSIHSFTFISCWKTFKFFYGGRDFNRILKFVMERGVQNLHFEIVLNNTQIKLIPYCNTLRVLTLSKLRMADFDRVEFPCVKTLNLNYVCFKDHQHVVKFLSGFPVLENLQTDLCLNYKGSRKIKNLNSNPLSNFVNAKISAWYNQISSVCTTNILQSQTSMLPVLHNFTHLELSIHDLHHSNKKCRSLLGILPYFPKLRHFNIQDCARESELSCICGKDTPTTVPECLSSQLQTCCIKGDRDTLCYFEFARYIVKHSQVLETMRINSTFRSKNQKLLSLLSSCTNFYLIDDNSCVINF